MQGEEKLPEMHRKAELSMILLNSRADLKGSMAFLL